MPCDIGVCSKFVTGNHFLYFQMQYALNMTFYKRYKNTHSSHTQHTSVFQWSLASYLSRWFSFIHSESVHMTFTLLVIHVCPLFTFITTRRYACMVYAVILCPSVCHKSVVLPKRLMLGLRISAKFQWRPPGCQIQMGWLNWVVMDQYVAMSQKWCKMQYRDIFTMEVQ